PTNLIDFLSTYLYGLIMIVFPLIFGVLLSLRLIVKKVDNGVMSYLLSSGVERKSVWFTQMLVIITNMFILIGYCTILGIVLSEMMFPGKLDIGAYVTINVGTLILQLTLSGICYMCSCIFNEYRLAALFGSGIPIIFIMIQMLSNMQGSIEWLKYVTLLTLFDPVRLIAGNSEGYIMLGILSIVAFVCYILGLVVFNKKSMSL
ncbi:ABC transporter permease subunit, partial [Thomasclavelia cocleata]